MLPLPQQRTAPVYFRQCYIFAFNIFTVAMHLNLYSNQCTTITVTELDYTDIASITFRWGHMGPVVVIIGSDVVHCGN